MKKKYSKDTETSVDQLLLSTLSKQIGEYSERLFLASVIVRPKLLYTYADKLKPYMFAFRSHQSIAEIIWRLYKENQKINMHTICDLLPEQKDYIAPLIKDINTAGMGEAARQIRAYYFAREDAKLYYQGIIDLHDMQDSNSVFTGICGERDLLMDAHQLSGNKKLEALKRSQDKILTNMKAGGGITGITTGFVDLDDLYGGWQRTDQIIVAARPGMGKTTLVLMFLMAAAKAGFKVLLFTLEMSAEQIIQKLVSHLTGISVKKIRTGSITADELERINKAHEFLYDLPFWIEEEHEINDIIYKTRDYNHREGIDMVIIDFLQLCSCDEVKRENRNTQLETISRKTKLVAKMDDCDLTMILLSQLSREVEKRGNKRPNLSDLRDSGALEQNADIIQFIFRPEYYGIHEDEEGQSLKSLAEIITGKNRHGELTTSYVQFLGAESTFRDIPQAKSEDQSGDIHQEKTQNIITGIRVDPDDDLPF